MKSRFSKKIKSHKKTKYHKKTKGGKKIYKKNKRKTLKHNRAGRMSPFDCRQAGCFRRCCGKGTCPYRCTSVGCHRRCP